MPEHALRYHARPLVIILGIGGVMCLLMGVLIRTLLEGAWDP